MEDNCFTIVLVSDIYQHESAIGVHMSPPFRIDFLKNAFLVALGLSYDMWDLVPWPGIKPGPPALGAHNLSPWTTGEVPGVSFIEGTDWMHIWSGEWRE